MDTFGKVILLKMKEGEDRGRISGIKEAINLLRSNHAEQYKEYSKGINQPYLDNKKWADWLELKLGEYNNE
jgi:hypothetical protein